MKEKLRTLVARRPTTWILAATVLLAMPAPAAAQSEARGAGERGTASSWPTQRPTGWSAGSVARGTGFSLGASERVREVQRKLNRLGYEAGNVDGLFGPITDGAVRAFQRGTALAVDGIVGPQTLGQLRSRSKRLERLLGEGVGFSKPGGSARVRSVQRKINALGYEAGKVDGLFGPITDGAVRRFQAEHGLEVDGVVGSQTLRRLDTRTESVGGLDSRPVERSRGSKRRPADRRPPVLDPRSAPLRAPWEGQPMLAKLATILVLGLNLLMIAWFIAFTIVRRSSASARPARAAQRLDGKARGPSGKIEHGPIEWIGARVSLSQQRTAQSVDTVHVELRLFVESKDRHWETDLLDPRLTAVPVTADELQERVRELVVPERLPTVAAALNDQGIDVRSHYLEEVFFVVELTREVERELLKTRLSRTAQ